MSRGSVQANCRSRPIPPTVNQIVTSQRINAASGLARAAKQPFAPTSKAKSSFLAQSKGFGFSGKRALLDQPSFETDIIHNQTIIDELLVHVREPVHGRELQDIDPDIIIDARCSDAPMMHRRFPTRSMANIQRLGDAGLQAKTRNCRTSTRPS